MRKTLLASTCLATLLSTAAHAETTIATATTAPVRTSTIKSGAPDDIKITSAGSIKPTVAGPAVTIDSNHQVVNEGTIERSEEHTSEIQSLMRTSYAGLSS